MATLKSWIAGGLVGVLAACGGGGGKKATPMPSPTAVKPEPSATPEPQPEPTPPPVVEAPKPVKLTPEQLAAAINDCFGAISAPGDNAKVTACYTGGIYEQVDSIMPAISSPEAITAMYEGYRSAFPDMKVSPVLTLVNGNNAATIQLVTGTNSGSMGEGVPPTNKKVGILTASMIELTDDGKIKSEHEYFDDSSFKGQLGFRKGGRKALADVPMPAETVLASASETEQKNAAGVAGLAQVFNAKDWKTFEAAVADDAVYGEQLLAADIKGKKNVIKHFKELTTAFPNAVVTLTNPWAAGDWVVFESTFTGTNEGVSKALGIKKKTGKAVSLRALHFIKLDGGKVKLHWVFDNGTSMAMQLGLVPTPAAK